jgi:hypothetical protein
MPSLENNREDTVQQFDFQANLKVELAWQCISEAVYDYPLNI